MSSMREEIKRLKAVVQSKENVLGEYINKYNELNKRLAVVAAENESLLRDKKWLMALVQSLTDVFTRSQIKER